MSLMNGMKFYLPGSSSLMHHKNKMDMKATSWISWIKSYIIILIVIVTYLCTVCYFGKYKQIEDNISNNRPVCARDQKYTIDHLTSMQNVTSCLVAGIVPNFYLTKKEAMKSGWKPKKGNLCKVCSNIAIGGDKYHNKDKQLPADHKYKEFDINFTCSIRGDERLVVSTDLKHYYYSKDHYKNFVKYTILF